MQQGDAGVSPIIGTLLVLTVFVVSMAAILFWGLPQYQATREQAQFDATRLDVTAAVDDLRGLTIAGTADTLRRPVISQTAGELSIGPGSRMLVSFAVQHPDHSQVSGTELDPNLIVDFSYQDWETDTASITIVNDGPTINAPLDVELRVTDIHTTGGTSVGSLGQTGWTNGASIAVPLSVTKANRILQLDIYLDEVDPDNLLARALLFDASAVRYHWGAQAHEYHVFSELGGVFHGRDAEPYRVGRTPLLSLPTAEVDNVGVALRDSLQVRVPNLLGNAGLSGRGSLAVGMHLAVNHELLSTQASGALRFYVSGDSASAWSAFLLDQGFTEPGPAGEHLYQLRSGTAYLPFRTVFTLAEVQMAAGVP